MPASPDSLYLTIRTRQEVVFQAEVKTISSLNDKGPFDILSRHAYFISLIQKYVKIILKNNLLHQIKIDTGVLVVEDNNVRIYLETQIPS